MLSLLNALAVYVFFLYFHFVFFLLSFEVSDDSMFGSSVMVLEETTVVSTTCKTRIHIIVPLLKNEEEHFERTTRIRRRTLIALITCSYIAFRCL